MRRTRGRGACGPEFGGSGEDSFVAVVVTKLTGALLFILLLTMVIMALLPKAVDRPGTGATEPTAVPLAVATPEVLPEAIAGRPYAVALAAAGGRGPLQWSVDGALPAGLAFDPASAQLRGTPRAGTAQPVSLVLRVRDGQAQASRAARLVVYQPDGPLTTPSRWRPGLPPIPWRAWFEQGFGFLILLAVHAIGMNAVGGLQRWSLRALRAQDGPEADARRLSLRFASYRAILRLATFAATAALAAWLLHHRGA